MAQSETRIALGSNRPEHGMKAKTIKAVLTKKLTKWMDTIEDETVRKLVQKNTIVTGGCIASMLMGENVNDYDLYFRTHETTKAVAEYYVARFKQKNDDGRYVEVTDIEGRIKIVVRSSGLVSASFLDNSDGLGSETLTDPGTIQDTHDDLEITLQQQPDENAYHPVFLSSNAITLSDKIQIVLRFYGAPDEIHENYDFAHCTNYWKSWDGELVLRPAALEALLSKELKYVGSKYPLCSIVRLRKFIARGWRINAGQVLKMCMQLSALDLTDVSVLEDQLTGVDTSYFVQLIARLKEKDPEKVNAAYLCEIVDRLF